MTWAKMKSANDLSGLIPVNSVLFWGLLWRRKHTAKTKDPTVEMKPDKKELKGNVPTKQQYPNWKIPVNITYTKYASMIFNFLGVDCMYSS
jgi:hypothetical protein